MSKLFKSVSLEDKHLLDKTFWRSFMIFAGPITTHMRQANGFTMTLGPTFERFYPEKERRADAMQRHFVPYNITQNVGTFCIGLVMSMEKQNAAHYGNYDAASIQSIKTSLMGPLSGIGDAVYWGIVRCIAASIGISFAAQGSILGPILFLLIYNIPSFIGRYYLLYLGYTMGENFITKAYESGLINILTKCASIVGLIMTGYMIKVTCGFKLALTMSVPGAEPVLVQSYLDSAMKGLLPLLLTLGCFYALKKGVNQNKLIIILLLAGILLGASGIC